jgi:hypothetical protein
MDASEPQLRAFVTARVHRTLRRGYSSDPRQIDAIVYLIEAPAPIMRSQWRL